MGEGMATMMYPHLWSMIKGYDVIIYGVIGKLGINWNEWDIYGL